MIDSCVLALDLGTTTLAGRLLDKNGKMLAEGRRLNPQREIGSDVITRLEAALHGEGERLQRLLAEGIDALCREMTASAGVRRAALTSVAIAANPAITTLLCGEDPRSILFPPHRPRQGLLRELDPAKLGLDFPVPLSIFPLVSGYLGGDLVAFLYGLGTVEEKTLAIDLGTNGEIALRDSMGWMATSVAAGSTFEGGGVSCGMLAGPGAIGRVLLDNDRLRFDVIDGGAPRGLAGSGLVSLIAAARSGQLIDHSGRIAAPYEVGTSLERYVVATSSGNALRLYRDASREIGLTQQEVRAFQFAKGAIRAGIDCLLQHAGIPAEEVKHVIVTGAFGVSLDVRELKTIAMLPPAMIENAVFEPGGALAGVSRFLLAADGQTAVAGLARRIKSCPLSGTPMFERAFLAALDF